MNPSPSTFDISALPTTRYQGSKRKIIPWIYKNLKDIEFETVLDGFGGTSVVSYLFKQMGKKVTCTDVLRFNYYIAKAIIENDDVLFSDADKNRLLQHSTNVEYKTIIQDVFRGIYYLDHENKWLDIVVPNIHHMNHYTGTTLEYKKALAFYALFQACIIKRPFNLFHRKNLNLRTNNVKRSFGNKTAWDTSFDVHFGNFLSEANELVFKSHYKCTAQNISVFDVEGEFDLVYLDAPYFKSNTTNETSNYHKIYHFLEGLTFYNEWPNQIDFLSRNLRLNEALQSELITKENIREQFEKLFVKFRKSKIVVSYKYGGVPSIDWLTKTLKSIKQEVYTVSKHYSYALNHQNGDATNNREVLIISI